MAEKRKQVIRITTGSKALDNLIGGGIESMRSAAAPNAGIQESKLHCRKGVAAVHESFAMLSWQETLL